jgi:hypothetical protein
MDCCPHAPEIAFNGWHTVREQLAQGTVDIESKVCSKLTEHEKGTEKLRIPALSEKIRSLNEVDFDVEKEQPAKEFKNTLKRIEESQQWAKARRLHMTGLEMTPLRRCLVDERIMPIL